MPAEPIETARNQWALILNHEEWRTLELKWLPGEMSDDGFKETLELLAVEGERLKPTSMLIDAVDFHHEFGDGVMEWRDQNIIPRYNAAGVTKFAFIVSGGPMTVEAGGIPAPEGRANFPTGWFASRERAYAWLGGTE